MLHFSFSSLIMTIFFSNLLLIMLYFIFKNTELMVEIGHKLFPVFLLITILRLVLPFEFKFTTTLKFPIIVTDMLKFLKEPYIFIFEYGFSVWDIFKILWIIGILFGLYKLARIYHSFYKIITTTGKDVSIDEPYCSILNDLCTARGKENPFRIFRVPCISSPMVFGIKTPYILLPDSLILEKSDMYYILSHESSHFFHHDLWLKFLLQILIICYWWNPFAPLLKEQISMIIEMRIDEKIADNPHRKLEYLECLLRVASSDNKKFAEPTIGFCKLNDSILTKRFKMMMPITTKKSRIHMKQFIVSSIIIGIYLFSILFIFEPYSIPSEIGSTTISLTKENAYLIENPNGGYDIYLENEFWATIDTLDETFKDFSIYKNIEELNYNE